jgi:hypothetical protein
VSLAAHAVKIGFVFVFQDPTGGRAGGLFGLAFGLYAPRFLRKPAEPRRPLYRAPARSASGTPLIFGRRRVAVA